ncbi:hypothetical protein CABS03_01676 [Colletotrichum abscissum]|uniref:C2H2-type domain-containing protein n=1 Tax=Colletotrichum limetticola TaxID=1209924 RepID=A0ABQ9PEB8_9PEZI|nr:hypothetical protein CLIM01_13865 [Colletotrichum limetticola]
MECQTCSDQFTTSEALHEHIGFYQSQAQYHVRELLRCLAHVHPLPNSHVSGDDEPGNRLGDTGASFAFDSETFSKPAHEVKDILGPSMTTTGNVDDQPVSSNTETFSNSLNLVPMGSNLDLSLNLGEPSLPHSQFYHALPTPDLSHVAVAEYGAHSLDPSADMLSMSKAPLMYAGTTLVSKAPLMYMSTQMFGLHNVEHELNGQAMPGAEHGATDSVASNMVISTARTGDGYGPLGY